MSLNEEGVSIESLRGTGGLVGTLEKLRIARVSNSSGSPTAITYTMSRTFSITDEVKLAKSCFVREERYNQTFSVLN
jgi:hypothetical protein